MGWQNQGTETTMKHAAHFDRTVLPRSPGKMAGGAFRRQGTVLWTAFPAGAGIRTVAVGKNATVSEVSVSGVLRGVGNHAESA